MTRFGHSYDSDGMTNVGAILNDTLGPTYTYFVRQDNDTLKDRTATFLGNITSQVSKACADIAADPILSQAPAINAIGFSQGGQFMRAYVERCNHPPVANLVTFGSQHNGISEFQTCKSGDWLCYTWEGFLKSNTWTSFSQNTLIPAQYYRDPEDLTPYLEHSNFLADVNNERAVKNATYVANMKNLTRFVMYMFDEDTTVVPKESAFFWDVEPESEKRVKLQDRLIYKEDWLGLKWLDERDRLVFKVAGGRHMNVTREVLEEVFVEYFNTTSEKYEFESGFDRVDNVEL